MRRVALVTRSPRQLRLTLRRRPRATPLRRLTTASGGAKRAARQTLRSRGDGARRDETERGTVAPRTSTTTRARCARGCGSTRRERGVRVVSGPRVGPLRVEAYRVGVRDTSKRTVYSVSSASGRSSKTSKETFSMRIKRTRFQFSSKFELKLTRRKNDWSQWTSAFSEL